MKVKKRTMNELRQTKDCHYIAPYDNQKVNASEVVFDYITKKRVEDEKLTISDFLLFLSKNQYTIVKQHV